MAEYTGNWGLYKWTQQDQKLLTIQQMYLNSDKLEDALTNLQTKTSLVKLGTNPRTIGQNIIEGELNIKDFGATGDGNDASDAIEAMFAYAEANNLHNGYIPDGRYGISRRINMPRGFRMRTGAQAVIYPRANVDIVKMMPDAVWDGGYFDLKTHSLVPDWDKIVFFFDATDMFQLYEQRHEVKNVNIQGTPKSSGWKGTAFKCHASLPDTYINNVQFNKIMITNIGIGFHFRVDPTITDPAHPSWVNACGGNMIGLQNFEYGFKFEGLNNVPRDVGGNIFQNFQLQAEAGTKHMIYCESALNRWDGFFWDLHKMVDTNQAFYFTAGSRFNEVKSAMASELTESWYDKGYLNSFPSPNSYTADKRVNAMPISTPGYPNFLGDQDDWLIYGHQRVAMTVTVPTPTGGAIPYTGVKEDILLPDTENGIEFDMTNSEYINPAVVVIELPTDPCWYASYVTAIFSWGKVPKGLRMEVWDELSNGGEWIWFHEIKENTSQNVIVSPPYSMGSKVTKIKISMFGANPIKDAPNNQLVHLARVMMTSQKDPGKAFMPSNYVAPTPPPPDIPPTLPLQGGQPVKMVGDQDDILNNIDRVGGGVTFTNTGKTKNSGEYHNMFRIQKGIACRWADPTVATPIVFEIDLTATGIPYMDTIGLSFSEGENAKNIKIERMINDTGTWGQVTNITNNTSQYVHVQCKANETNRLKFTISEVATNNVTAATTKMVRINRVFAMGQQNYPATFISADGGGKTWGDVEIMDATKGIIMKTPDGTKRYRITIDNAGALITTLI